jgi:hypothetical protein
MHVVRNLSVVTVDAAADTVSGMADPGAPVDVWPGGFYPAALVQMTSGEDGAWRAALDGLFDLVPGSSGRSRILDGTGNSTAVDWLAPTPPSSATTEPTTAIASLALDQSTQASLSLQNPSSMAGRWQGGGISPSSRLTASSQEKQYEQCP